MADTSHDLIAAANACFLDLGYEPPLDYIRDTLTAFLGGSAMLTLGFERLGILGEHTIHDHYAKLLIHYERNIDTYTTVYPGVKTALKTLKQKGYKLGVCTNKPILLANKLLKQLDLYSFFDSILGADSLPVRKPDPIHFWTVVDNLGGDRKKSLLIGDTMTDRLTAKNANVLSVLVGFGPLGQEIKQMNPDVILNHYSDLPHIVDQLLRS